MTTATLEKNKEQDAIKTPARRTVLPNYKVHEKDDTYQINVILPGVDEQNLNLEADGQWLVIKASPHGLDTEGFQAAHLEFTERDYECKFRIPSHIDRENISARLAGGILEIALPKAKESRKHAIKISAS